MGTSVMAERVDVAYTHMGRAMVVVVERFRSVCQNRRWQITGKHTCIRRMWLRIMLHGKLVHGCMVYPELAPRRQQFHVAPAM